MRAISYPYFNIKKQLKHHDQCSMNNVLIEFNESNHYYCSREKV